jgi:hypothetical protein
MLDVGIIILIVVFQYYHKIDMYIDIVNYCHYSFRKEIVVLFLCSLSLLSNH